MNYGFVRCSEIEPEADEGEAAFFMTGVGGHLDLSVGAPCGRKIWASCCGFLPLMVLCR